MKIVGLVATDTTLVGVASDFEGAYRIFKEVDIPIMVLCVQPPHCRFVDCAAEAHNFFKEMKCSRS